MFRANTGINELCTLSKHISCKCKCKFDGNKCNSNQWYNNDICRSECKKDRICEKDYIWNHALCSCKNGKNLASIINDSVIKCDEIIDADMETKTISKNIICNTKKFLYFTRVFINYN